VSEPQSSKVRGVNGADTFDQATMTDRLQNFDLLRSKLNLDHNAGREN